MTSKGTAAKKPAAKAAAPKVTNPTAPEEVVVPPIEAAEPLSVEAPTELMQIAGGNHVEDPRPLAVIASNLESRLEKPEGKTLFVTKSKDQAIEILANGKRYPAIGREGVFVWEVANEDVEMFSAHSHVQHGRIVQSTGK